MASARLMITIPSELNERLEPFRSRLNLSAICADAIERKVKELEEATGPAEKLADMILRLRSEAAQQKDLAYQLGFARGEQYAYQAPLEAFQTYEAAPPTMASRVGLPLTDENYLSEQLENMAEDRREQFEYNFTRGWHDGLMSIWRHVKTEL